MKQFMLLLVLLSILITGCSQDNSKVKRDKEIFVNKLSMKQIDSLTAEYNYYFSKNNAVLRLSSQNKDTKKTTRKPDSI